jgi:hypothetical protein
MPKNKPSANAIKPENVKWALGEWGITPFQFLCFVPQHQWVIVQRMTERGEGTFEEREIFRKVANDMVEGAR